MQTGESVTQWLDEARAGDPEAAQRLWQRYFTRLVDLARARLRGSSRAVADEEDVALSAFDSFCRGAAQGRFPRLADRDNLWSLLVVITARKVLNLKRDGSRQKRGGARAGADEAGSGDCELEEVIGREPSPAFAAQVAEECQRLLDGLGDETLRAVAVARMEGYTNEEIAQQLGCAPRTVERKLGLIRGLWQKEDAS